MRQILRVYLHVLGQLVLHSVFRPILLLLDGIYKLFSNVLLEMHKASFVYMLHDE